MNRVTKIEGNPPGNAVSLFKHAQKGGGLVCLGMTEVFANILMSKNFKVRLVSLVRTLGDGYSTHAILEVLLQGRWVIFDPTFNLTFEKEGRLVSAQDIHRSLLDGSFNEIKPIFHGEVSYPARLNKYYMHYLSLYNNVLVNQSGVSFWSGLPPFRYWLGPKYYVQIEKKLGQKNQHMIFFNTLNFFFGVVLPLVLISLSIIVLFLFIHFYNIKKRDNN